MFDRVVKLGLEHDIMELDRVSHLDKPGLEHGIVFWAEGEVQGDQVWARVQAGV